MLALVPRCRPTCDDGKGVFGRVRDEPGGAELPQRAGPRIEAGEPDPTVSHEPFDCWVAVHDAPQPIGSALHDDCQARRLVDLHHLPRKPGPQIALRPIHDAKQRRHVVRQLCAAAVPSGIDVAEIVLKVDSGDDGHDGGHDSREDRTVVVPQRIV